MITVEDIESAFYPVVLIGDHLVRSADELPKKTHFTYFDLSGSAEFTPITESLDLIDDDFARFVLTHSHSDGLRSLTKKPLPSNKYGFSHLLSVPPSHHSLLKGRPRLEPKRPDVVLCLPIFEVEFSGTETVDEFYEMRRHVVPTTTWNRMRSPS